MDRKRPEVTDRERTVLQLGQVPVRVVVQFLDPLTSEAEVVEVGATVWMSGATDLASSASASWTVSVDAEPKPPRVPLLLVELPGETTSRLVPSSLIWACTLALAPWPRPTVSTTAVMPIRMPSMVRADRSRWVRTASVAVGTCLANSSDDPPDPSPVSRGHRVLADLAVADLDDSLSPPRCRARG